MIVSNEKDCCGCAACSVICPVQCVQMKEGSLGHLFPSIDSGLCVNCGRCETVCPMQNKIPEGKKASKYVYAAFANDENTRYMGSSGGMFEVFADELLTNGYCIYGAAFDGKLQLKCTLAESKKDLLALLKSKYIQSDLSEKYLEIKNKLDLGEKVFFISTPCQVSALKLFLSSDYENLLTVDFFCHGVPSQRFFSECLAYEENKKGVKIKGYTFRAKRKGGATPHYYTETVYDGKRDKRVNGFYFQSPFYAFFQTYICLRESCYNCRFSGSTRPADVTIGDFHEIENYVSRIDRFKGVSRVVVNTEKGAALWEKCADKVTSIPMDIEKLISDGVCFGKGTSRPKERDEFLKDYDNMTMENLVCKWVAPYKYWVHRVYYHMPVFIRNLLKKIMGGKLQ